MCIVIINRVTRLILRYVLVVAGLVFHIATNLQIRCFGVNQYYLRLKYKISPKTIIRSWDAVVQTSICDFVKHHSDARYAYTSGSTSTPKRVAFTKKRLQAIKRGSFSVATRLALHYPVKNPSIFILASLKTDDSLTSLLLNSDGGMPNYIKGIVTPSVYFQHRDIKNLIEVYGATAVRLWLFALCNPSLIYSTNPSTLASFWTELEEHWTQCTRLIRDFVRKSCDLPQSAFIIAKRVSYPQASTRLARIANAPKRPAIATIAPALRFYTCWDGGYVRPFLEQIERYLPKERYTIIPMYSMSTETVMTLNVFDKRAVRFLPIARGVYYEFLPIGASEEEQNLISAEKLEVGKSYSLVVSDPYGLRRYHTNDVFLCKGVYRGLPDLHFQRRLGIAYSFTGEKLTGQQITEVFTALANTSSCPQLSGLHLTVIPSRPLSEQIPHYRFVLAFAGETLPPALEKLDKEALSQLFDHTLANINGEFADKRASQRLNATRIEVIAYNHLAAALDAKTSSDSDRSSKSWESQFKLLPLYSRLWEEHHWT